ncbi:MAG: rod shape-determining protein MreD [Thermincola sp.]|nr:rod shape-determining protein MreD [Thermincola sp.]MDT3704374.1 rod shape-determining protein MreD [Thermincola sp.]
MRYFIMIILFLVSLILQSTIFSHLSIAGVKPDLVLVFVVFYALLHGSYEGALVGLMGGLLQDLLFGQELGMNTLAKSVVGYVFGILEKKIYKDNILIPIIALLLGTVLNETILYLLRYFSYLIRPNDGSVGSYFLAFKGVIIYVAIYNACFAPFIYGRFYRSSYKGWLQKIDR